MAHNVLSIGNLLHAVFWFLLSIQAVHAQVSYVPVSVNAEERLTAILNGSVEVKHYLNLENHAAGVILSARRDADTVIFTFTTDTYVRSYRMKGQELYQLLEYFRTFEEIVSQDNPISEVARRFPSLSGIVYPYQCAQKGADVVAITWERDTVRGTLMALGASSMVISSHPGVLHLVDTVIVVPYKNVRLISDATHEAEQLYLAPKNGNAAEVVNAIAAYMDGRPTYQSCMPPEVRAIIDQPYPYELDDLRPDPSLSSPIYGFSLGVIGSAGVAVGDPAIKAMDSMSTQSIPGRYSIDHYTFTDDSFVRPAFGLSIEGAIPISHELDLSMRAGLSMISNGNTSYYSMEVSMVSGRIAFAWIPERPDVAGYLTGSLVIGAGVGIHFTSTFVTYQILGSNELYTTDIAVDAQSRNPFVAIFASDRLRLSESLFLVGEMVAEYCLWSEISEQTQYSASGYDHVITTRFSTPTQFTFGLGVGIEYTF